MSWENWLKNAAKPPSDSEESRTRATENEIYDALNSYGPLKGKPFRVYAKGSYANNTNVRLNYDVDIAVEYYGYFFFELCFDLRGHDKSEVGIVDHSDPYTPAEFKRDVLAALVKAYGSDSVTEGRIAYRVREKKTTLPADVVPCWEFRRYDGISDSGPIEHVGSRVFPSGGGSKDNFPEIQRKQGIEKNNATGRRYKRAVRALKKLQTLLVEEGALSEELPSYFTECLVSNVSNDTFQRDTYLADMRGVLAKIFNETMPGNSESEWTHVHGLMYLFRGDFSQAKAHEMADVAWRRLGFE